MSGTIAQLGIEVNSGDAVQAATDLDKLTEAGVKAEKASDGVSSGFDKAATAARSQRQELDALLGKLDPVTKKLNDLAVQENTLSQARSAGLIGADTFTAYQKKIEDSFNALAGLNTAQKETGETADEAKARILQLVVAQQTLTTGVKASAVATQEASAVTKDWAAEQASINARRQTQIATEERLAAATKQAAAATGVQADGLQALLTKINPTLGSLQKLDDLQASLSKHKAAGNISGDDYKAFTADIEASRAKLSGLNTESDKTKTGFAALGLTSKVARENVVQLGNALAEGNIRVAVHNIVEIGTNAGASALKLALLAAPILAVGAALGIVAYAYSQGSKEQDAYNQSLILTGGFAGTSAGQLADLARQVSSTVGTTGAAAAALATLAGNGKIAGGSFEEITVAALAMEKATGKSVDSTIAEFIKIADDPVAAAKSLNDQYHFLTASTYAQIVALKEQGDSIGATKLLTDTYADTVKDRAAQITQNLGFIERGWKGIKGAAADALDAINNVGRQETLEQQIQSVKTRLADPESYSAGPDLSNYDGQNSSKTGSTKQEDQAQLDFLLQQKNTLDAIGKARGLFDEQQKDSMAGLTSLHASYLSGLDKEAKKKEDIRKLDKDRVDALKGSGVDTGQINREYDISRKAIDDKYKDPKAATGQVDLAGFNDAQRSLKDLQGTYSNTAKQLDASQKAGLISADLYATQKAVLLSAEKDEVTAAYGAEITALENIRDKSTTTAAQRISLDQKITDARASMVKAQKDADSQLEVLAMQEQGRVTKQKAAIQSYIDALDQQNAALKLSGQRAAVGAGQGDRQNTLSGQLDGIADKANQERLTLARDKADASRNMSADEYNQKLAAINKSESDLAKTTLGNYDAMSKAQGDWSNGATSAYANYLESARNVAGQTKSLFTNAFSSMDDALANFAVTGKLSFSDFAKSIITDLAKIAEKQASSAVLGSLFGLGVKALGAIGGGAASAGSTQAGYTGTDLSNFTPVANAKGGVYDGPGISAYSSSVVSTPTVFAFAKGTGLMGEAGPEAIMPLTRGANGKLGVQAIGGGNSSASGGVAVSISIASDGKTDVSSNQSGMEAFGAEIGKFVESKYKELEAKSLSSQGNIRKAISGRA